jgi:hypothetical protein
VTIDDIIAIVEKAREGSLNLRSYTGYKEILQALKQYQAEAEYQSWTKAS